MNTIAASLGQARKSQGIWFAGIAIFVAAWFVIYNQLPPFAQWLVTQLPIATGSHLASSVEFFFYDTPKVLMLLTLVVLAMGVVRTFFSPDRSNPEPFLHEFRTRQEHITLSLTLKRTFG